jgi:aspartate 1-decarboxylase
VRRRLLNGKIHRAVVTRSDLDYVGSIALPASLREGADFLVNEQVAVFNLATGARFETYVIDGAEGEVVVNGAAARLAMPGDKLIVVSYVDLDDEEVARHTPHVVHVDEMNRRIDPV